MFPDLPTRQWARTRTGSRPRLLSKPTSKVKSGQRRRPKPLQRSNAYARQPLLCRTQEAAPPRPTTNQTPEIERPRRPGEDLRGLGCGTRSGEEPDTGGSSREGNEPGAVACTCVLRRYAGGKVRSPDQFDSESIHWSKNQRVTAKINAWGVAPTGPTRNKSRCAGATRARLQ